MEVTNYDDYRLFIRELIRKKPSKGRGEVGRLANFIGVHSTFVSQVLGGGKDFSAEQAFEAARYFNLSNQETKYFLRLVDFGRAGSANLKKHIRAEMESEKSRLKQVSQRIGEHRVLTDTERAVFYSSWIYSAVRMATSIGKGQTLEQICNRFSLSRPRALEILLFLCSTGLCYEEENRYYMGTIHTHVEQGSPFASRHHSNWRIKAIQKQEDFTKEELAFTAPFSVNKKDFDKIREKLLTVINESIEIMKESEAEEVACMTLDLFWAPNSKSD